MAAIGCIDGVVDPIRGSGCISHAEYDAIFDHDFDCTINGLPMPFASEGDTCRGFNEKTGKPFPVCAKGLVCQSTGGIGIPGAGNVCMQELAGKGETC